MLIAQCSSVLLDQEPANDVQLDQQHTASTVLANAKKMQGVQMQVGTETSSWSTQPFHTNSHT